MLGHVRCCCPTAAADELGLLQGRGWAATALGAGAVPGVRWTVPGVTAGVGGCHEEVTTLSLWFLKGCPEEGHCWWPLVSQRGAAGDAGVALRVGALLLLWGRGAKVWGAVGHSGAGTAAGLP